MKFFTIISLIFVNTWQCQSVQSSCRSNCSINGTTDDQCWHEALNYRSSELVQRLFSFSSLSVYIELFRGYHPRAFDNTTEFLNQSLQQNLLNESLTSQVNQTLFNEAIDLLLRLCRELNSTKIHNVRQLPSLFCSTTTCLSDIYNYLILFIISALVASLVIIICIVQLFQTRRKTILFQTVSQTNRLQNTFSTTNTSVNTPYLLIMLYSHGSELYLFVSLLLTVNGERDLFQQKCRRDCNTKHGSLECWQQTTDGFTYGLSTAMIDYCQVILQLRQTTHRSWYNTSRDILIEQIREYDLNNSTHQLSKNDIERVALLILDKCFNSLSSPSSFQPPCPSCSIRQVQLTRQWRLTTLILTSICVFFFFLTLLFYMLHVRHARRSYQTIS